METIASANTYYNAATERMLKGDKDSKDFFEKAAKAYMEVQPMLTEASEKTYVQNRINDCILNIRKFNNPPKKLVAGESEQNLTHSFKIEYSKNDFSNVAGMSELKTTLEDAIILPLVYPELNYYTDECARGIILYGPPGTGKTYISRAVAGEASKRSGKKVGFIYVRGSDFVRKYFGETEQNVRSLFETAAENAPIILFFDEIQSIGLSMTDDQAGHEKRVLTEMLQDFDIIENKDVLVLGATNYPQELDPALFRNGRFDERILINPPDLEARIELFKLYSNGKHFGDNIDHNQLAVLTQDYTAADIKKICNDAGRLARREHIKNKQEIKIAHEDLARAISKLEPSIYNWVDKMKSLIDTGKVSPVFSEELNKLIEQINSRRVRITEGN